MCTINFVWNVEFKYDTVRDDLGNNDGGHGMKGFTYYPEFWLHR